MQDSQGPDDAMHEINKLVTACGFIDFIECFTVFTVVGYKILVYSSSFRWVEKNKWTELNLTKVQNTLCMFKKL